MSVEALDIVGIGTPVMDVLYTPDAPDGIKYPGGTATNIIVRLQKFGFKTGLIGGIGDDEDGEKIREELIREGVDISRLRDYSTTARNYLKITPEERKFIKEEGYSSVKELYPEDEVYLASAKSVILRAGHPVFETIVKKGLAKRLFVLLQAVFYKFDYNLELLEKARIDTIFGNEEEVEGIKEIMDSLLSKGTRVIRTLGKRGCDIYTQEGYREYPGYIVKPIDPTGAGDAFVAGFIYSYFKEENLEENCKFANACGALATTHYGARSRLYTPEEIKEFIRKSNAR